MTLQEDWLPLMQAVGALGQVATAIVAAWLAYIAHRAVKDFNRGQAEKFSVDYFEGFNADIVRIAQSDPELASKLGRPVAEGSDIIVDYFNFRMVNHAQMQWIMFRRNILPRREFEADLRNCASYVSRFDEGYFDALLKRGYLPEFAAVLKKKVVEIGGFGADGSGNARLA